MRGWPDLDGCSTTTSSRWGPRSRADTAASDPADGPLALAVYDGAPTDAGPQIIATAGDYVDAPVVFLHYSCPSCWTALSSAVVPADHPDAATTLGRLTVTAG
ncbi:hypothetical protein GCM10009629_30320 [Pseudonocardia alni]